MDHIFGTNIKQCSISVDHCTVPAQLSTSSFDNRTKYDMVPLKCSEVQYYDIGYVFNIFFLILISRCDNKG